MLFLMIVVVGCGCFSDDCLLLAMVLLVMLVM